MDWTHPSNGGTFSILGSLAGGRLLIPQCPLLAWKGRWTLQFPPGGAILVLPMGQTTSSSLPS